MSEPRHDALLLAEGGVPRFKVVTRPQPSTSEEYAAEELRRHLQQMCGAGLGLRYRFKQSAPHVIYVNHAEAANAAGIDVAGLGLGAETLHVETRGANVHVLGGGPRGVLYGVYELLERLGCRWFTPEVTHIPRRKRLALAPLTVTQTPAFDYRDNFNADTADPVWRVRNRFNGWHTPLPDYMGGQVTYGEGMFVHTHFSLVPAEKWFDSNPEFFAMIQGKRRRDAGQLCLSNMAAAKVAAEAVLQCMRDDPRATIFSVSQMDGGGQCECPACTAVAAEEGAQSANALRFANAVAEITGREFPGKLIDTLAYGWTVDAPKVTRPHPNVRVRLCSIATCMAHPLGTCGDDGKGTAGLYANGTQFLAALEGWSRITSQLHIWHYCTDFAHSLLPMPDFDELEGVIRLYQKHKVYGLFMQGLGDEGGGAESQLLRGYVVGKLLWDPQQAVWPIVDEFLPGYYGKAAAQVRKYLDVFHEHNRADRNYHISLNELPTSRLFADDLREPADAALAEGERLATGEHRWRVRLLRNGLTYAKLGRQLPMYRRQGNTYTPVGGAHLKATLESLRRDCRKAGILFLGEGQDMEHRFNGMSRRLVTHPVEVLTNQAQELAVTPTLCGRGVEWHCHGRQWFAEAGGDEFGYPSPGGYMEIPGHVDEVFKTRRGKDGSLVMTCTLRNGLWMSRTFVLTAGGLRIESRVENRSDHPVRWSWGARTRLILPGPARVEFGSATGPFRLEWDDLPNMLEPPMHTGYESDRCPLDQWLLFTPGYLIVHRFDFQDTPMLRGILGRDPVSPVINLYIASNHIDSAPGGRFRVVQHLEIQPTGN